MTNVTAAVPATPMNETLWFNFFADCEATQPAVNDRALGERAAAGVAEALEARGMRGTFQLIPTDAEASPALYRQLASRGHEIGLHLHPAADGYEEFLGVYGPDMQRRIVVDAADRVAQVIGAFPATVLPGYASANDHTYGVLYDAGFRNGMTTFPTRVLPECASVHAGVPLDVHYAHRFNRTLVGDLDFVEIPITVDPDSRLWGGKSPLDLRVELVDAKNHWHTLNKAIDRQARESTPLRMVRAFTHNVFDYANPGDFRRQTLERMLDDVVALALGKGLVFRSASASEIAAAYRAAVPLGSTVRTLELDRRGWNGGGGGGGGGGDNGSSEAPGNSRSVTLVSK
jgi:peptidoglycan/xylan/chitin deacetylase (PgdA/CDA1 family)